MPIFRINLLIILLPVYHFITNDLFNQYHTFILLLYGNYSEKLYCSCLHGNLHIFLSNNVRLLHIP